MLHRNPFKCGLLSSLSGLVFIIPTSLLTLLSLAHDTRSPLFCLKSSKLSKETSKHTSEPFIPLTDDKLPTRQPGERHFASPSSDWSCSSFFFSSISFSRTVLLSNYIFTHVLNYTFFRLIHRTSRHPKHMRVCLEFLK